MLSQLLQQIVLETYGIRIVEAELVRDLGANVYRVKDAGANQFVLKDMSGQASQYQATAQAIVTLTQAIRQQTTIAVPTVYGTQNGQVVMDYQNGQGEERTLVMYSWVEGELSSRREPTPELTYQMGEIAGRLHRCATGVTEAFALRRYDQAYVQALGAEVCACWPPEVADQRVEIQAAVHLLADKIQQIGYAAACFGLIHADFHFGNMVITPQGAIGLIDFDEIAYGHYLFDLTNMINEFADYDELGPVLQEAFVRGYLAIRPEMTAHFVDLPWFVALSSLVFVHWVFTAPGEKVKQTRLCYIPDALGQITAVHRGF